LALAALPLLLLVLREGDVVDLVRAAARGEEVGWPGGS